MPPASRIAACFSRGGAPSGRDALRGKDKQEGNRALKTTFNRSRAALLTATSALAMIAAGSVHAQTTPAASTEVEEVIITGFRASLASDLAAKKDRTEEPT